jgi:hypothetical protein
VESVLIVLQQFPCDLGQAAEQIEMTKGWLRQQFFTLGGKIAQVLRDHAYQVEIFDPRTGLPTISQAGTSRLDDVAIAHTLLGYPVMQQGGCQILVHPQWHNRVYPATLLSSAPPDKVKQAIAKAFP